MPIGYKPHNLFGCLDSRANRGSQLKEVWIREVPLYNIIVNIPDLYF